MNHDNNHFKVPETIPNTINNSQEKIEHFSPTISLEKLIVNPQWLRYARK